MIRLMIVEDNEVVRAGLIKFFSKQKDITVIAETADGTTAVNLLKSNTNVDIVIADWNMPDMDGLELTTKIMKQFSAVKTVILTMHGKQEYKDKAKAAGAKGYILKDGEFDELVEAIKAVAAGKIVFM